MPRSFAIQYANLKAQSKTPLWSFAGTGAIILFAIIVNIVDLQKPQQFTKMILSPRVNDIYEIKQKNGTYTLFKVDNIAHDTLSFLAYKYQSDKEDGLSEIEDKNFNAGRYMYLKSLLLDMNKNGEIVDINRKY